jgi:hypothetical protein
MLRFLLQAPVWDSPESTSILFTLKISPDRLLVKSRDGLGPFIKVERQALVHIDGAEWPYSCFRPRYPEEFS